MARGIEGECDRSAIHVIAKASTRCCSYSRPPVMQLPHPCPVIPLLMQISHSSRSCLTPRITVPPLG